MDKVDKLLLISVVATLFQSIGGEGELAYNKETQICCNGVVFNADPGLSCCGYVRYNNVEQQCCGGVSYGINKRNADCCYNDVNDNETPFYKTSDICCNGKVWKRRQFRRGRQSVKSVDCCGTEIYDQETQLCCNENDIRDKNGDDPNVGCCVNQTYNTLSHMCCRDTQLINGTKMIQFSLIPMNKNSSSNMQCCGTVAFDPEESVCCTGGVVRRPVDLSLDFTCCGTELLTDPDKDLCCGDKIHTKTSNHTECCGLKTIYNKEKHICCGQNIFSKTNVTMRCCKHTERLYDPNKEMCCRMGLVTLSQEDVDAQRTSCCEVEHPEYARGMDSMFHLMD